MYVLLALSLMGLIIRVGLKSGLERACKYLMPVLLLFLGFLGCALAESTGSVTR